MQHADDGAVLDSTYPDLFLECRGLGHLWKLIGYYHQGPEVVRAVMCSRCRMDRHDRWSRGGERLGATYSQPDGYRIGDGGASKWEVRQETLSRVTIFDSADAMHAHLLSGKGSRPRKKATG